MGRIVVSEFVTLDGVIEDPGGAEGFAHGGWAFKFERGAEGDKFKLDEVMEADAMLLGRVTYEGFAQAWPERTDEAGFADKMNGMRKYVVSSTLTDPAWNNSVVIRGDLAEEVAKVKAEQAGDILVAGSRRLGAGADRASPGRRVPADGVPDRAREREEALRRRRRSADARAGRGEACRRRRRHHADLIARRPP